MGVFVLKLWLFNSVAERRLVLEPDTGPIQVGVPGPRYSVEVTLFTGFGSDLFAARGIIQLMNGKKGYFATAEAWASGDCDEVNDLQSEAPSQCELSITHT
jgi:hypothetical protein